MEGLLTLDARIVIRPHPEFVKRFPQKMKRIHDAYGHIPSDRLEIQDDFSCNATVYESDVVITDWSSIAQEFSFTTKKPSLFINTPMKVMNPEWRKIGIEPMELWMRDMIGVSLDVDKLDQVPEVMDRLLGDREKYRQVVEDLFEQYLYNLGTSAQVGGDYLIEQIEKRRSDAR
jgi:YidC/Oxa1 family membrane protein insertase